MIKAGIIGSTGYAGGELARLLLQRDDVEIKWYGSRSYIDQKYASIYQNMFKIVDDKCMDDNMKELADQVDVIFTATPQGLCSTLVNEEILSKVKIIDLSADFCIRTSGSKQRKDQECKDHCKSGMFPNLFLLIYLSFSKRRSH